ncbi:MAG: indole-3-glycerol phosphate synthase TrpC [Bacteroidota bacterium]
MNGLLQEILAYKETELKGLDAPALQRAAAAAPPPRDFLAAISRGTFDLPPRLIAELKLASPSRGMLAPELDIKETAGIYAENGASAISVLTDKKFFHGRLESLRKLRFACQSPLPLLRKDFIIAESQLYESRANGADAVLLIVAAFSDDGLLAGLHDLALELGLTPLVEIHDERESERALRLQRLRLIGINNRDLSTFRISLETTERLRPLIPPGIRVISESGISGRRDVERLTECNIDAMLVGEALVTAPNIAAKVRELAGVSVESHD